MSYFLDYINNNNNIFKDMFNDEMLTNLNSPNYVIKEKGKNEFYLEVELPGHDKNTIEIEEAKGSLTIRKKQNTDYKDNIIKEFKLAKDVNVKEANIKNGLLKLILIKIIPEEEKPTLIKIN